MLPAGPGAEIVRALVMELVEKRELHVIYLRELSEMKPVLADPRGRKVMAEMDAVLGKK